MIYVRTLFDTLAYAKVNGNFAGDWIKMAGEVSRICADKFNAYIYVPIESHVPVVNDGVRNTDLEYRRRIDVAIHQALKEYIPWFVEVRGSLEERVQSALDAIVEPYNGHANS
ncbi:AAA family ATPase, partial [Rhodoplanes sp. SY1]|uniref:AAA family ATPase n=1 Tax=Rhodoplanes sp. SY1 TaxID=3166646 RepID=UPI0038B5DA34